MFKRITIAVLATFLLAMMTTTALAGNGQGLPDDTTTTGETPSVFDEDVTINADLNVLGVIRVLDRPLSGQAFLARGADNQAWIVPTLGENGWSAMSVSGDAGLFFNSDVNGSKGFVIAPWSSNSYGIRIASNGRVGINKKDPESALDVSGTIVVSDRDTNARALWAKGDDNEVWMIPSLGAGGYNSVSQAGDAGLFYNTVVNDNKGFVIGPWSSTTRGMRLDPAGNLIVGGTVTTGSSRDLKNNISQLTGDEAVEALMSLMPVKYNYKANAEELELGFIAEDVPDLVARNDRKSLSPMDFATLSVTVIQELKKETQQQQAQIDQLKALVNELLSNK